MTQILWRSGRRRKKEKEILQGSNLVKTNGKHFLLRFSSVPFPVIEKFIDDRLFYRALLYLHRLFSLDMHIRKHYFIKNIERNPSNHDHQVEVVKKNQWRKFFHRKKANWNRRNFVRSIAKNSSISLRHDIFQLISLNSYISRQIILFNIFRHHQPIVHEHHPFISHRSHLAHKHHPFHIHQPNEIPIDLLPE